MIHLKMRCERIRPNNGIVEVFFVSEDGPQNQHALFNVLTKPRKYEVGKYYPITIGDALADNSNEIA